MPSRADVRRPGEWLLRGVVITVLAVALWRSTRRESQETTLRSTSDALDRTIQRALTVTSVHAIDVDITRTPTHTQRELLVALQHADVRTRWRGDVAPLAMEVIRDRDPLE